jgi:uncharacterized protein (DUF1810 family)
MDDPYNLQRFVDAQNPVFAQVRSELLDGRKRGHWMWYVFPQFKGLGKSDLATKFAISSGEEAESYLEHPLLGPRLRDCTQLVTKIQGRSIDEIFGYPDTLKFQSSMTLFAHVAADKQIFMDALNKFYAGESDRSTVARL